MPIYGEKQNSVLINGAILVWDGITAPETSDQGKQRWSAKIVVPPSSPDIPLLQGLADQCLLQSKWKGQLPMGGRMPIGQATVNEFNGLFPGWYVINCTTYKPPNVHEEGTGVVMQPMAYAQLMYTGQRVDVVVSVFDYDNIGKGIGSTLEGICPVVSAQAQPVTLGSGGVDATAAFGGGAAPAPVVHGQQPAQATDFLPGPPAGGAPAYVPPGGVGAAPAYQPPAEPMYVNAGQQFTRAQLQASGWPDAAIDALPRG